MLEQSKYKKEFERLFKDNYNKLYYYALNLIHNPEDAKDVVSDAFRYLWEHYEDVDDSLSVVALLYALVKNSCIDKIRHLDVQERHEKLVLSQTMLWTEYEYQERDERIVRIISSIEKLPLQTKIIFKKCFLDGKKYKEVSEDMCISTNTVKTHIMKALRLLRGEFVNSK